MAKVSFAPATQAHALHIAARVRPADREEIWAMSMQTPLAAMLDGIRHSDCAITGLADGVPQNIWGVVPESLIGNVGIPWMVAADTIDRIAPLFLRASRVALADMAMPYDLLQNWIDARNVKAIRWLRWLGFDVEAQAEPAGPFDLPFHRFTMRKEI